MTRIAHPKCAASGLSPYRWNPDRKRAEYWWSVSGRWIPSSIYDEIQTFEQFDDLVLERVASFDETWAEPLEDF